MSDQKNQVINDVLNIIEQNKQLVYCGSLFNKYLNIPCYVIRLLYSFMDIAFYGDTYPACQINYYNIEEDNFCDVWLYDGEAIELMIKVEDILGYSIGIQLC